MSTFNEYMKIKFTQKFKKNINNNNSNYYCNDNNANTIYYNKSVTYNDEYHNRPCDGNSITYHFNNLPADFIRDQYNVKINR